MYYIMYFYGTANFSSDSNLMHVNSWLCPRKHFICNHGCTPSEHGRIGAYVCNGESNCYNDRDENFCDQNVSKDKIIIKLVFKYLGYSI
jgi:hypothetical protein